MAPSVPAEPSDLKFCSLTTRSNPKEWECHFTAFSSLLADSSLRNHTPSSKHSKKIKKRKERNKNQQPTEGAGTQIHNDGGNNTTPVSFSARKTPSSQNTTLTVGMNPSAQSTMQLPPLIKFDVSSIQTCPHPSELLVFEGFSVTLPNTQTPKKKKDEWKAAT